MIHLCWAQASCTKKFLYCHGAGINIRKIFSPIYELQTVPKDEEEEATKNVEYGKPTFIFFPKGLATAIQVKGMGKQSILTAIYKSIL